MGNGIHHPPGLPEQEPRGVARSALIYSQNPETGETTYGRVEHSRIWINSDKIREFSDEAMILLLAHELLHTLGFLGHPDPRALP